MLYDNITILLSFIALSVSLINLSTTFRHSQKLLDKLKEKFKIILDSNDLMLEVNGSDSTNSKDIKIDTYLEGITRIINEIYPKSAFVVSIKLISKTNMENPLESEVVTWALYPNNDNSIPIEYKIKNNSDFSSIIKDNNKYFFVSDLKKYSALTSYTNESSHYIEKYNTSIVCPIQKNNFIIGFLCVDSPQKLNNVKKNKKLIDFINFAASLAYKYITERKLNQETIATGNN